MWRVRLAVFLLLLVAVEAVYFWLEPGARQALNNSFASIPAAFKIGSSAVGLGPRLEEPMNLLLMGEDISYSGPATPAYGWQGNTDTMILARFDPVAKQVAVLSLPRDTYAEIPGHGFFKINAATPYGGPELAVQPINKLLNLNINHYALVNVFAVRDLVNQLGGVEVYVPEAMNYDDNAAKLHIHFKVGQQTMNGDQAMAYLRFRHDAIGDIGRVQRQQAFMESLLAKGKDPATWLRAPQLFATFSNNVHTDLSKDDLAKLAGFMAQKPQVVRLLLPGTFWTSDGISFWRMDEAKTQTLLNQFFLPALQTQDTAPAPSRALPRLALRGKPQYVEPVLQALRKQGYNAYAEHYQVENIPQTCLVTNGDVAGAKAVAAKLGLSCVEVSGTGSLYADYTLLVGANGLPLPKPSGTANQ